MFLLSSVVRGAGITEGPLIRSQFLPRASHPDLCVQRRAGPQCQQSVGARPPQQVVPGIHAEAPQPGPQARQRRRPRVPHRAIGDVHLQRREGGRVPQLRQALRPLVPEGVPREVQAQGRQGRGRAQRPGQRRAAGRPQLPLRQLVRPEPEPEAAERAAVAERVAERARAYRARLRVGELEGEGGEGGGGAQAVGERDVPPWPQGVAREVHGQGGEGGGGPEAVRERAHPRRPRSRMRRTEAGVGHPEGQGVERRRRLRERVPKRLQGRVPRARAGEVQLEGLQVRGRLLEHLSDGLGAVAAPRVVAGEVDGEGLEGGGAAEGRKRPGAAARQPEAEGAEAGKGAQPGQHEWVNSVDVIGVLPEVEGEGVEGRGKGKGLEDSVGQGVAPASQGQGMEVGGVLEDAHDGHGTGGAGGGGHGAGEPREVEEAEAGREGREEGQRPLVAGVEGDVAAAEVRVEEGAHLGQHVRVQEFRDRRPDIPRDVQPHVHQLGCGQGQAWKLEAELQVILFRRESCSWERLPGAGDIVYLEKSESTISGATKPVPFLKNERTNYAGLAKAAHEKQWMGCYFLEDFPGAPTSTLVCPPLHATGTLQMRKDHFSTSATSTGN